MIVLFFVTVLATTGIVITRVIPRRFAPYVESPLIGIVTMMPGMSAEEMELYVSKPIEEQMLHVEKVRYIRSNSQEGYSLVSLEFDYGADMDKAAIDVQTMMDVAESSLPKATANLKKSWVIPIDPLNIPIVTLSLTGDAAKGWDMVRLRELADNEIVNRLKEVRDVFSVVPFGGYRRQLQVIVDRDRLAAYRLSILDVRNAIDRYNVSRPAGNLTTGESESIIRLDTRATSAEEVLNYPLTSVTPAGARLSSAGALAHPRVVYVRDVARVLDSHWERRSAYHYLKHEPETAGEVIPSIRIAVIQDPGASSARVAPRVMEVVRRLENELPGIKLEVAYDNAKFVNILFNNVWDELLLAVLLTGLMVLLFMGEWRGTLVAVAAIPASLALAILFMVPFGMTLNSGTLIGLLISIGRLVDDTVVDVHAVERHLRMGKSSKEATVDGIGEVRLAVIVSTVTLVIALTPLLFSGGITQAMFWELVWPIIFALIASTFVSFTLTAVLCAKLLRPEEERRLDRQRPVLRWLYVVLDPFQRFLDRVEAGYGRAVRLILRRRFFTLLGAGTVVMTGFTLYFFIGSEMMPLADVGQATGKLEMRPGTSFAQTERAVRQLEQIILTYPEVEKASVSIGAETMFETWSPYVTGYQASQPNTASLMLTLSDKDTRKRTIFDVIDGIQREAMSTIPDIRRLQIMQMGSDVMATAAAPIHLNIFGPDVRVLDQLGAELLEVARKTPGIFQPATTWELGKPAYEIDVDLARAEELGLSSQEIAEQAYYALRGGLTTEFYRLPNLRQNTIQIRYEPDQRRTSTNLEGLYITAKDGRQVPLNSLATLRRRLAPTVIEHDGMKRVLGVTGYYRKGSLPSMDVTMELMRNAYAGNEKLGIEPVNFPRGYGLQVRGDMTQMMDSFRRLLFGLMLAVLFMYLVLAVQFRGIVQIVQMMASLPLELAGVFIALWVAGQAFSTVSILGIIVLVGMDITTAILLIDMIMRYRDRGVPRDQAVAEACPQRLRPILITSITTMIVLLPIALAPKTGLDAYQPLATTIVGGLIFGTLLSLFVIPVMHTLMDDAITWVNRTYFDREWVWPTRDFSDSETPPAD